MKKEELIQKAYEIAVERYAAVGVDTEKVLKTMQDFHLSLHCWQADDVAGFEVQAGSLTGGIQATGNYPGKARNIDELRADILKAASYIPGTHRLNLHEIYGDFQGKVVDRDQVEPEHFKSWIEWGKEHNMKLDFNSTSFSHPKSGDLSLSNPDEGIRQFWIEHTKRCRAVAEEMGKVQGDGMGTQLYSELCSAVAAVHDIDTSTDEGEKKMKQQVLQCAVDAGRGGMLTDSDVEIVSNYKQRTDSLGIKWQALSNCSAYDYVTSKITIDFPISVTPLKDYKNTTTEVVKTTNEGAVVKIGERYYSLTSNWNNAVKFSMADVNGEKDFDGIYTHKANFFDDNKQWILDVRFVSHLSAFFNDDFKIYLNEVDTPEEISDKTDNSDVVMTYHSIYTRSGEVVYPGGSGDIIKGK